MPLLQVWDPFPYSLLDGTMDNCPFCFKSEKQVYPSLKRHEMNLTLREDFAGTSKGTVPLPAAVPVPYLERQHLQWEVTVLIRANPSDILLGSDCICWSRQEAAASELKEGWASQAFHTGYPGCFCWLDHQRHLLVAVAISVPGWVAITQVRDLSLRKQRWCFF